MTLNPVFIGLYNVCWRTKLLFLRNLEELIIKFVYLQDKQQPSSPPLTPNISC